MAGQAARVLNPDTLEDWPIDSAGVCDQGRTSWWSLDEPERTAEVMDGDWFVTGDLARIDGDGFIHIEGRLSRFSKIAGEMVPHGTVEECLNRVFELQDSEVPMLAVAGRPDAAKGEALVLLAAIDIELDQVRERLTAEGLSNLWIPKQLKRVESIPTLATGKLDLRAIQDLAAG